MTGPTRWTVLGAASVAGALAASLLLAASTAERRPPTVFERLLRLDLPLRCGGERTHDVALTFDDGPGVYTKLALRILRHAHARATFFLVGKELRYWPALPRAEARIGALGDHTWTHPYLPVLSQAAIHDELASTRIAIERASGVRVELFRPPYGATNAIVAREAAGLGMIQVLWSIDSRDSEGATWYGIGATVIRELRGGSIVLMHENHGQTIRALKYLILPYLARRHLVAVTVPQLLERDPPTLMQLRRGLPGC